ncbi:MAG: protein translocase subunit SecD [Rhodospirillales bacterium]|nr:protein translocase subunit SecD [Rhodospirillales bacterium]
MLHFSRLKIILISLVVAAGIVFVSPNFLTAHQASKMPDWVPHQQINLGLDLQGGSHLLLEVEVDAVIRERLEARVDDVRSALRGARVGYTGLGIAGDAVTVRIRKDDQIEQALTLMRDLAAPLNVSLLGGGGKDIVIERLEGNLLSLKLTDDAIKLRRRSAVEQSIEIVRRRIDETGTREPTIQRQGDDRILIQLPGVDDPDRIKRLLGRTAKMTFHLVDPSVSPLEAQSGRLPPGSLLLYGESDGGGAPAQPYVVRKHVVVGGDTLVDAQTSFDQGQPVVNFRFDSQGGRKFGDATKNNVGNQLAIVLDNKVVSAPVIRAAILGGSGIISGSFTVQEANDLALLLRAGALPAPLKILEERSVGPDLGADSVRAGKVAAAIGFAAVIVYIALAYGLFGLAANVALLVNMALIGGALSLLQATLTLPGIAGVVLTIGMAVDANVLIFERIREEVRSGKTPFAAVDAGYKRALGTIMDANVTTLIAAVILFGLGSGPVKGFAVTLAIGIITSVFTAFTLTRLIIATWLRRRRPITLPI